MNTADSSAGFVELLGKFKALVDQKLDAGSPDQSAQGLERFEQLLKDFGRLPRTTERRPKTLLEIAEFPHWELAHSNILAFFLDPNEEHGLGDLFLKSLLEACGDDLVSNTSQQEEVKVEREVRTVSNKSVDILVETERLVIGIENKIHAPLRNPLHEYEELLKERANKGEKKRVVGILLNLSGEIDATSEDLGGFKPITYDALFSKLRSNLGHRVFSVDSKHLAYLVDFVATIENLKRGTHMDPHLMKFLRENEEEAFRLHNAIQEVVKELEQRGKVVKRVELPASVRNLEGGVARPDWDWTNFGYAVWCQADLENDAVLCLEVDLTLESWTIYAYVWKGDPAVTSQFIENSRIRFEKTEADSWIYKTFDHLVSEETVKNAFQEFINLVAERISQLKSAQSTG